VKKYDERNGKTVEDGKPTHVVLKTTISRSALAADRGPKSSNGGGCVGIYGLMVQWRGQTPSQFVDGCLRADVRRIYFRTPIDGKRLTNFRCGVSRTFQNIRLSRECHCWKT